MRSGTVHTLIGYFGGWALPGAVLAGVLFSSVLTAAPAAAVLGELSQSFPLVMVAAGGALGSAFTDLILLTLVRGHIAADTSYLFSRSKRGFPPSLLRSFARASATLGSMNLTRYAMPLMGALFIALPFLPDEAGVTLMGFSKLSRARVFFIAYVLNFAGIFAFGLAARGLGW